jgi:hypothetical protein
MEHWMIQLWTRVVAHLTPLRPLPPPDRCCQRGAYLSWEMLAKLHDAWREE